MTIWWSHDKGEVAWMISIQKNMTHWGKQHSRGNNTVGKTKSKLIGTLRASQYKSERPRLLFLLEIPWWWGDVTIGSKTRHYWHQQRVPVRHIDTVGKSQLARLTNIIDISTLIKCTAVGKSQVKTHQHYWQGVLVRHTGAQGTSFGRPESWTCESLNWKV